MRVNFDANASIKPLPEVLECLSEYQGQFLNPSSVHQAGQAGKRVLDEARTELAELLNLKNADKIIFTSGATEANNAALTPIYPPSISKDVDLACSAVEHSSVLEYLRNLSARGYNLKEISPAQLINCDDLAGFLNEELRIFALMAANNETGQIFDIKNISQKVRSISARTRIHCDAVQALGKIKINFQDIEVDTLAISGHKIGAITGVGALVIAEGCQLQPWIFGGPQEFGYRAGTENILAIKTLAIACRAAKKRLASADLRMSNAREQFLCYLGESGALAEINQPGEKQLPNTISVRFPGIKADDLVVALDLCGVAISAGSACTSGRPSPSHVLLAQGMSDEQARETVRISFEPSISVEELQFGLSIFQETITRFTSIRRAA